MKSSRCTSYWLDGKKHNSTVSFHQKQPPPRTAVSRARCSIRSVIRVLLLGWSGCHWSAEGAYPDMWALHHAKPYAQAGLSRCNPMADAMGGVRPLQLGHHFR
jgi:hypothetical protein